jgi:uncharacterized membrane protein (DUF106 family)
VQEGFWELASVNEDIIEHNHLCSMLQDYKEELQQLSKNKNRSKLKKLTDQIENVTTYKAQLKNNLKLLVSLTVISLGK